MNRTMERYQGLWAPEGFWSAVRNGDPELDAICNGVGSQDSWTYALTPDTVWGLDVTPSSDIHDWMYTKPSSFASDAEALDWKGKADRAFRNNLVRQFELAEAASGFSGWLARRVSGFRRARAQEYFLILQNFGGASFWSGKNRPSELGASEVPVA